MEDDEYFEELMTRYTKVQLVKIVICFSTTIDEILEISIKSQKELTKLQENFCKKKK